MPTALPILSSRENSFRADRKISLEQGEMDTRQHHRVPKGLSMHPLQGCSVGLQEIKETCQRGLMDWFAKPAWLRSPGVRISPFPPCACSVQRLAHDSSTVTVGVRIPSRTPSLPSPTGKRRTAQNGDVLGSNPRGGTTMHSFTSESSFQITGRGISYAISADQIPEGMWDPCVLTGTTVLIDGTEHLVKGVGTFAILRSPTNPYSYAFNLLT